MQKVIVIGCPGGGKSTFSRALQEKTGLPLFHLDMMYWNADRTIVPKPVFLERLRQAMEEEAWIIDGNYGSTMELRLQACDTVFFLDYPVEVCLSGIAARSGKPRSDMPWYEDPEKKDEEFLDFVKAYNRDSRPKVLELLKQHPEKQIVIFRNREETSEFLQTL